HLRPVRSPLFPYTTLFRSQWERDGGGGGLTMVMDEGNVFEKGGVNISRVYGDLPEVMQKALKVSSGKFFACGLSMVIHPKSPKRSEEHTSELQSRENLVCR